jgi:hypothetical protein
MRGSFTTERHTHGDRFSDACVQCLLRENGDYRLMLMRIMLRGGPQGRMAKEVIDRHRKHEDTGAGTP